MASFKTVEQDEALQEQAYNQRFDTDAYLNTYCTSTSPYFSLFQGILHNIFALEITSGETLLDLGTGPNPYTMIAASKRFKNIVGSDFLESNRNFIRKWLRADPDCHDFGTLFKQAAALEYNKNHHELEERVRKSVREVIPCNVHLVNPIYPDERKFDVVLSSLALCGANSILESYRKSIANVSNLLNPGGKLIIGGCLECNYYFVGDQKFDVVYLTKDTVHQALLDAGLNPVQWVLLPFSEVEENDKSDCRTTFLVVATKISK